METHYKQRSINSELKSLIERFLRMKIYTKTGDTGTTAFFDGTRASKDHIRIETYGDLDELNSVLGLCRSHVEPQEKLYENILVIQRDLLMLGSLLANLQCDSSDVEDKFSVEKVSRLEKLIDYFTANIEPLKNFVVPGGNVQSAHLDWARCVCRRVERKMVTLHSHEPLHSNLLVYINRLSDLLFMMARWTNSQHQINEEIWRGE